MKDKIEAQRKKIEKGNPILDLVAPCQINDGIESLNSENAEYYLKLFEEKRTELDISFFVPASGSGSRMFSALFEVSQQDDPSEESRSIVNSFIENLRSFPFFDSQLDELACDYKAGKVNKKAIIDYVITSEKGLQLGLSPKGLIPFHKYDNFTLNPFQEHLAQGSNIAGENAGFHFTINAQFETEIKESLESINKFHGTKFHYQFSEQDPETDSVAFHPDLTPVKLENGELLKRPAGHGALLGNLNQIDADIIFIRNIDNMQHMNKAETSLNTRKILGGALLELSNEVHNVLSKIERSHAFESSLKTLNEKYDLRLSEKQLLDSSHAYQALNRPIRICGMVKNVGQPGGGPFWVNDAEGNPRRQIVEKSQIIDNPDQVKLMEAATHFNPVELVCSVRNYKGEKFDLNNFVDNDQYFIVHKTHEGEDIVYLEEPGLWNGSMDQWITVFYEIESECFSPVKTVMDLLESAHQA
ncbi:MAG: DUF4301 family protein [Crocinitomicaceae bacterium]|nr:DUF4301 family protein [Crocinitomicaceae bacterium]